jgi:hypothetical protein
VALGIGLLIGAERERRKGEGPLPTAGTTSLVGAVSIIVGGECCLRLRPRGSSY